MRRDRLSACIPRRYRLIDELGEGGMGRVFLVEDLEQERALRAMKWVRCSTPPSSEQIQHHREFQILSRFQHPHLLNVHHFGRVEPNVGQFFTSDHLAGGALADLVSRLDEANSLRVLVQILRGLAYLHSQGWVHGDVKPENVLLRSPWGESPIETCLIDFGLAHPEGRPAEGKVLGTVYYMAPEQILGARMDCRGDLYSLGVLAYRLFTGRLPFEGASKVEVLEGHVRGTPPLPRSLEPAIPREVDELLMALLSKRAGDRPGRAEEVLEVFHRSYGTPKLLETPETLKAYVRRTDFTGWETSLEEVEQSLGERLGNERLRGLEPSPWRGQASNPTVRLLADDFRADTGTGMVLIRHSSEYDLERFRRVLTQHVELMGIPTVTLDGAGNTPIVDLIRGVLALLPSSRLRDQELFYDLAAVVADDGQVTSALVERLVRWLLAVASASPFVVILDEPESLDPTLFEFLERVAELETVASPLLWIGFHGGGLEGPLAAWLSSDLAARWVKVVAPEPLDPEALTRWLGHRFPGWTPPKDLLYVLEEESEGNPGQLEKILVSLIDEGLIERGWDGWRVTTFDERQTPLVQLAKQSFEALPEERARVLGSLVVLGGSADVEWLCRVSGLTEPALREALAELAERGWTDHEEDGDRYRLRYFFQMKAVRESIPEEDSRRGNARVAEWLLAKEAEGHDTDADRLANHLLGANEIARAVPYARRAARHALSQGRVLRGIRWFERLVVHDDHVALRERLELLDELGDLRQEWGPPEEILTVRRHAVLLARAAAVEATTRARFELKLAEAEAHNGAIENALAALDEVDRGLRGSSGDDRRAAELLRLELGLARGDDIDLDAWERTLEGLGVPEEPRLEGWEFELRAKVYRIRGELDEAREQCRAGIARLEQRRGPRAAAWAIQLQARELELGDGWLMAIHQYRIAAHLFARCREPLAQARALRAAAELYLRVSDLAQAELYIERAGAVVSRIGAIIEEPALARLRLQLATRRGATAEAESARDCLAEWSDAHPQRRWGWECAIADAATAIREGRLVDAERALCGKAHPTRCAEADAEIWVRWGLLNHHLALLRGRFPEAMEVVHSTVLEVRRRGRRVDEIPLWIAHWQLLGELCCQEEAGRVRESIERWVAQYPEHEMHWLRACGRLSEREVLDQGEVAELARYYCRLGVTAVRREDWSRGAFLLEEGLHNARRGGVMPLEPLLSARLANVHARITPSRVDEAEATLRRGWRRLVDSGVILGRPELLGIWARCRLLAGDRDGAMRLRRRAVALVREFGQRIPFAHDVEAFEARQGLDELLTGLPAPAAR